MEGKENQETHRHGHVGGVSIALQSNLRVANVETDDAQQAARIMARHLNATLSQSQQMAAQGQVLTGHQARICELERRLQLLFDHLGLDFVPEESIVKPPKIKVRRA